MQRATDESAAARSTAAFLIDSMNQRESSARRRRLRIRYRPDLVSGRAGGRHVDLSILRLVASARNTFTVALSGEGSDELFFGYRYYTLERLRRWVGPLLPEGVRRLVRRGLKDRDLSTDMAAPGAGDRDGEDVPKKPFKSGRGATFYLPEEIAELLVPRLPLPKSARRWTERLPELSLPDSRALAPYLRHALSACGLYPLRFETR